MSKGKETKSWKVVTTMLEMILNLRENEGLTLKNYIPITYKTGWQVATEGMETHNPVEAVNMIAQYGGNCGVWFSKGFYYIDKSHRVNTKREAMEIGRACHQISVLNWRTMGLAYC